MSAGQGACVHRTLNHVPTSPYDVVLAAPSVLDLGSRDAWLEAATELLERRPRVLHVDMSRLRFIDAAGLGWLVRLRQRSEAAGARLVLHATPAHTLRLMVITGLDQVLLLDPDPVDAPPSSSPPWTPQRP